MALRVPGIARSTHSGTRELSLCFAISEFKFCLSPGFPGGGGALFLDFEYLIFSILVRFYYPPLPRICFKGVFLSFAPARLRTAHPLKIR